MSTHDGISRRRVLGMDNDPSNRSTRFRSIPGRGPAHRHGEAASSRREEERVRVQELLRRLAADTRPSAALVKLAQGARSGREWDRFMKKYRAEMTTAENRA